MKAIKEPKTLKKSETSIKQEIVENLKQSNEKIDTYIKGIGKLKIRVLGYGPHPEDISNAQNLEKAFKKLIETALEHKINSKDLIENVKDKLLTYGPVTKGRYRDQFNLIVGIFSNNTDLFDSSFQNAIQGKINERLEHKNPVKSTIFDTRKENGLELH